MNIDEAAPVTAAAIARRAGVGRAAVSNWRRRYADFPQPVGGSVSSPVFSWMAVQEWLTATGKAGQLITAGMTDTGTQRIDDGAPTSPDPDAGRGRRLTPAQFVARVMASLLPFPTPGEPDEDDAPPVLDPACSDGALLLAVADRFGDHVTLVGQCADEPSATRTWAELRDHPQFPPYDVQTGDALIDNDLDRHSGVAAGVVCVPPSGARQWPAAELAADARWRFGVPDVADADLAWAQHSYAQLRPRGVAVVQVAARSCVRPSGRSIRAALVRSGVLRDVIALPGADTLLWVLQRAADPGPVRFVDLSTLMDQAGVPDSAGAWDRLFTDADPAAVRSVPRVELLDGDTDLLPSRHVAPRPAAIGDDLVRLTTRVQSLYPQLGQALPLPSEAPVRPDRGHVTLAELERTGTVTIRSRDITPRAGDVLLRTLGRPPVVAQGTDADDVGVAQVVEIDPAHLDPHFVAMFLRADAAAIPAANTHGALSREDLRRCRVPRIAVAEQRRYGEAFRRIVDLQQAASALAAVTVNVLDQTIHSLTTGALAPYPPVARETIDGHRAESETL